VEVPVPYLEDGKSAFPDYHGGYFEWHGKVEVGNPEDLKQLLGATAHVSRNALKGQTGTRLVTLRNAQSAYHFNRAIENLTLKLDDNNYQLLKSEAEYCCFDSNKSIDHGWSDVPEITDESYLEFLAYEGFLRRMTKVTGPFMLKGSLALRQYLSVPSVRKPGDIDLVCLEEFADGISAEPVFTRFMTQVTETYTDDGMSFRSFTENAFWRRIDYAMHDDFPTANTDLLVNFENGQYIEISLDVSWNIPISVPPVPLVYHPTEGAPFKLKCTVPIALQISWKLHQTVVNTRVKDLMDLVMLLEDQQPSEEVLQQAIDAYVAECKKDKISATRILRFLNDTSSKSVKNKEQTAYANWKSMQKINPAADKPFSLSLDRWAYDLSLINRNWETPSDVYFDFVRVSESCGLTSLFNTYFKASQKNAEVKRNGSGDHSRKSLWHRFLAYLDSSR